jgi:hypothetical protein
MQKRSFLSNGEAANGRKLEVIALPFSNVDRPEAILRKARLAMDIDYVAPDDEFLIVRSLDAVLATVKVGEKSEERQWWAELQRGE